MRRFALLLPFILHPSSFILAADRPVPTKDAAAKMTVPEGFRVTLFAGEPDVVQPIAFTFDDRGRMWVVECVTYPKWVQPGQKGKDRVVILEDTDGDGVHDKKTVVLDDGVNLSGIELGFGGVYLCSTPNLIHIPIKDDKPSGPPAVLLDGWNLKDAKHNVFNGLAWGPDGWLYGCNGIQTKSWVGTPGTPQDERTYIDAGVWRFHPTKKTFEVVATGTTNPWGLDWDAHGEMFITNCVIDHLWHVVPGGRYQRMHGQDTNPFSFGLMGPASDHKHWAGGHWTDSRFDKATGTARKEHGDAGGGHAHSGCMVYLGDNFPAEYRNSVFTCNIHGNRLNRDTLHRTDRGYVGKHAPDFLFANDPWFRGICVKQGPEGAVYVSDWCDTGECHNYEVADTTNGRIYRVAYGTPKAFRGDVSKMTTDEWVKSHESKNEWLVRKARRLLQEETLLHRRIERTTEFNLAAAATGHRDPDVRWRAYATAASVLPHPFPGSPRYLDREAEAVRVWAVRLGLQDRGPSEPFLAKLRERIGGEKSRAVRAEVGVGLSRVPADAAFPLAAALFARDAENADADLTQAYWFGIQPAVLADPAAGLKLLKDSRIRRVRTNIVRMVLSIPNSDPTKQLELVLPALAAATDDDLRFDILSGILQAFADRKRVTPPAAWEKLYPAATASVAVNELADELALKFGDERAVTMLMFQATHHKGKEHRSRAVERLAPLKKPELHLGDLLRNMLADPEVRGAAVRGLAFHPDPETPAAVLKAYPSLTAAEKADAVQTLASRKEFADKLLDAVAAGSVPKSDLTAFTARQIVALNDKAVTDKLAKVWGTVQPASATRVAQTAKWKTTLTADYVKAADLPNGRAVYARQCAACHKLFGDGGDVGPELTGSQRANLDYVLENVLDPNATVPFDYKMTAFYLADGRVVTGLVKGETKQAVTVRTANEQLVIPVADIESRKPTNNSVMPEGLLDPLSQAEVRDLIAYLKASEQVPLKK